ncbi:GNAT family N-acetyltransferase [Kosakonia radicincitans DSM 16656]|uniref:Acetyltransferase (GNAT) domain-containing protein n=1 Tax=Kosakonia radicincitans TaxID=283686 RepID=A0AAX2EWC7_9ENTR|nr:MULTISPECIES: GNAT family N-acetyltransferase [Kosakonia]MDP9569154.1 GNAT superfamily N-acetyltransferase [Kosakonia oryzae]ARD59706.1 GNAT family N-acetyltransferase [Kosakonia radicincitans DSM 16656]PTA88317.1 N-acetyltransferase [Kosakonia sp. H7A]QEM90495.1 N-acetyltransferase [Kosakonia radicincitans]SES71546.1 Acetyltransferase (GNAT) domain-containing protein [Kosakonia radicincitans]
MAITLYDKSAIEHVDWQEVTALLAAGGLNQRDPALVEQAWRNSTFCWFGYHEGKLVATARAISDLTWASYAADIVVAPEMQGRGYGKQLMINIVKTLLPFGKTFIYSVPEKTGFYQQYGFRFLTTGMVCATSESLFKLEQSGYIR